MFKAAAIGLVTLVIATSAQAVSCSPNVLQAGEEIIWQGRGQIVHEGEVFERQDLPVDLPVYLSV